MIPEIDIWQAANLMVKRYGDKPLSERTRNRRSRGHRLYY
jgi:hypothetical protein